MLFGTSQGRSSVSQPLRRSLEQDLPPMPPEVKRESLPLLLHPSQRRSGLCGPNGRSGFGRLDSVEMKTEMSARGHISGVSGLTLSLAASKLEPERPCSRAAGSMSDKAATRCLMTVSANSGQWSSKSQ